ncbi:hypothetical protein [Pseudoalteromonas aurantia]|uniref:Uncharacterized protein n=1 Tax=Pseudoalteromonas aurantia TaxID=43654 RepID=A0A5S3V3P6_9GAMM|nr:hypothetical protein [Pseudoalteromonas aurantia]TMO64876.1 hypothetical protein CWC19_18160 [Pseudoalteromonas aurantia]
MKLSYLILLTIASVAFFYIQLWDDKIVTPLYFSLLALNLFFAAYTKNINMAHITGFILIIVGANRLVFETGLINDVTPSNNLLLQGLLIYGTSFLFSLALALILIFRVQLSRILSSSKNIELTHFDGIFHWIFIYMALVNLIAMAEYIGWSYFEMKSWRFIYNNFEAFIYIGWALSCGALLTMMICSSKDNRRDEVGAL